MQIVKKLDRLAQYEAFIRIADAGSISRAAESLGASIASVSRALAALEERLDAVLIRRNTRSLTLTEEGLQFLARARAIISDVADSEAAMHEKVLHPNGVLRVSASLSFIMQQISPLLPDYLSAHPDVRVHLEAANRYVDLIDNGIDVAIRTREFEPDSNITVRRLAETRRVLVASPDYVARAGAPNHPSELSERAMLLYTYSNRPRELDFERNGEKFLASVSGLIESNDGQILRAAALAGLGIIVQPSYIVHDDILAGRLQPLLDDWDLPRLTINIAYPSRKFLSAKVRTFVDFLLRRFAERQFETQWTGRYDAATHGRQTGQARTSAAHKAG